MRSLQIASFFAVLGLFAACGGGDDGPANVCVPGTTMACVCSDGASGAQACTSNGSGYGACECGSSEADAGEPEDMGTTPYVCGPSNCDGCCSGNVCRTSSDDFCGSAGGACTGCGDSQRCEAGICRAFCDATNCDGCCSGTTCLPGRADDACGASGDACLDCGLNECGDDDGVCYIPADSRWDVVPERVELPLASATKLNGDAWDAFGGAPDLYVIGRHSSVSGPVATSGSGSDSFSVTFGLGALFSNVTAANLSGHLSFTVYDEDGVSDDYVGGCSYDVNASGAFGGSMQTLNCPRNAATNNAGFVLNFRLVRR
jgi:hypothetical protein